MTAPERIWAFEDEGGGVPRSGIWIDEQSECPDGSPEYVLASTAREAALQYLSDAGQMMERIADLTAANTALTAECARLKGRDDVLRAIADLTDISGVEFKRKHPELNNLLDDAGRSCWGEALSEFAARAYLAGGAE